MRCWNHFVARYVKQQPIAQHKWFQYHYTKFMDALRGRYKALGAGMDVPAPESLIVLFEHGKRTISAKTSSQASREAIVHIVKHIDNLTRSSSDRSDYLAGGPEGQPV